MLLLWFGRFHLSLTTSVQSSWGQRVQGACLGSSLRVDLVCREMSVFWIWVSLTPTPPSTLPLRLETTLKFAWWISHLRTWLTFVSLAHAWVSGVLPYWISGKLQGTNNVWKFWSGLQPRSGSDNLWTGTSGFRSSPKWQWVRTYWEGKPPVCVLPARWGSATLCEATQFSES